MGQNVLSQSILGEYTGSRPPFQAHVDVATQEPKIIRTRSISGGEEVKVVPGKPKSTAGKKRWTSGKT
jgi:hypothetical protein